ncbi:MAG: DUF411 domain-containing protein [Balneolaceae bacterium]|nr:DUF411 domain-containing protein [Balneolaceae bacterium]
MKPSRFFTYAALVILAGGVAIWYIISTSQQTVTPQDSEADIVMYKNEGCQCCDKWATYMQSNGFSVSTVNAGNLNEVKTRYGVPHTMGACHTAVIDGYVVEGHVPVEDVRRLLEERPDAIGVAVPGMPASSPGMNTAEDVPYESYLVDKQGNIEVFGRHR